MMQFHWEHEGGEGVHLQRKSIPVTFIENDFVAVLS